MAYTVVILEEPMDGISELIEQEGYRSKAKWQASVNIKLVAPLEVKKVPIFRLYGNEAKGISEVYSCHEGAIF